MVFLTALMASLSVTPSVILSPISNMIASSVLELAMIPNSSSPNLILVEKSDSWMISSSL